MSVWQKLLMPAIAGKFVRDGLAEIGGPVVRAADVVTLSPAELVASYGLAGEWLVFPANPEYVDLLRFAQVPLMRFTAPDAVGERPWPTYENGFLRAPSRAPVWNLARTRVPMNAEIWRKYADGREELLAHYGSLSKGWTEARGYYPPLHLVGARAKWRGLDLPAEFLPNGREGVELVWMGDEGTPAGFEEVRPAIHRRLVPFSECEEIFEVVITASWNGIRVRVLQRAGDEALVLLENPEWDEVTRIRAGVVEPGIFAFLPPMRALRDYLLVQPRPAQVIKWLRMGPSTDVLRDIASGRVPVESILDAPRPGKPLIYLRTLLLDAGALPRDAAATRQLMAWATQTIGGAPTDHHQMLRTYTRWVLLRRASRDAEGDIAIGAARHVKASLRGLVTFLTWAEEQQTPLRALTQAQIEEFITLHTARRWLPQFLTWAAERDITPDLDISRLPRREPAISTFEAHLENVIRTLATDRGIALDARLAALLIAVYGLPATKTLALHRRQLRAENDGLDLRIGDRPLTLPAPITLLAREQLDLRPDADDDAWLFPGRLPGQPLDPQSQLRAR